MYKHLIFSFLTFSTLAFNYGCITTDTSFSRVAPGVWRGVLELDKFSIPVRDKDTVMILYDQFKPGELPFSFEVVYTDAENFYVEIINGSERIRCDSIAYGRNKRTARDTVNIYFPEYSSYIHADVRGPNMQGEFIVTTKENYRIPFYAQAGKNYRFTNLKETPTADLSGAWAVSFGLDKETQEKAIGEFKQTGNHLEGTFRTETGDYRFLEGTIQGRKFWMSTFDGTHVFLFSGSVRGDSLFGEFRSGKTYKSLWAGWRDPDFELGDANTLTRLKPGSAGIAFDIATPDGRQLQFPGPDFNKKIKIFTIMGTWCPNCRDEQVFLRDFLKNNPETARDIQVVAFSFERHKDPALANAHLLTYKEKMGIAFDIVYGGKADKKEAEKLFPALEQVMAFPTMMVLDKNNRVRRIHTGFDGPATSRYAAFQQEFAQLVEQLKQE